MAIISDFQEEEPKPSSSLLPPLKPLLTSPWIPPTLFPFWRMFLINFLAKESNFLQKENVDKAIAAIVRVAKEKSKKKKKKKKNEEVASKAEVKKKEVKEGREIKEEHKKEPMEFPVERDQGLFVVCEIAKNHLIGLKGQPPIIDRSFSKLSNLMIVTGVLTTNCGEDDV
ncbi:hypothetical protein PTKIN_Ptkin01aG0275300 [Pterospermum kingtungense]